MISDTIFDSTSRILQELAWYTVTHDYTDDQIREVINSLAKYSAIGIDLDIGGDGVDSIDAHMIGVAQNRLTGRFNDFLKEQQKYPDEPVWRRDEDEQSKYWAKMIHDKLDGYHDMPGMHVPFADYQKEKILEQMNAFRMSVNDLVIRLEPSKARSEYFEFVTNTMASSDATNSVWVLDQVAELLENCRSDNEDEMADLALQFACAETRSLRALILWGMGGIVRNDCWLS